MQKKGKEVDISQWNKLLTNIPIKSDTKKTPLEIEIELYTSYQRLKSIQKHISKSQINVKINKG